MGRRNPNGYGCVTKLSGHRSRPWMVKVTIYDQEGKAKQIPVGYAATEAEAKILLAQYNNNPWDIQRETVTLVMLFNKWTEVKATKLSEGTRKAMVSSFRHLSKYYGVKYRTIKSYHMQDTIDHCGCGSSTQSHIKNLWWHLDRFAFELNIIDKMYSQLTTVEPSPETSRTPFTQKQIDALWKLEEKEPDIWIESVLIYIYTGFRLTELLELPMNKVNMKEWIITAGIKTRNGKGRVVPVHERIRPFFQKKEADPYVFTLNGRCISRNGYYGKWNEVMQKIGASEKTPHEARHTFETLLDNAGGNRKCIDMLMGHKPTDTGNRVYNHKTLDQLRETIALLK